MSLKVMPNAVSQSGIELNGNISYPAKSGRETKFDIDVAITGRAKSGYVRQTDNQGNESGIADSEDENRIKSAIDQANERIKQSNGYRRLAFSYNKETGKISIKVYDEITRELIKEIPPDKNKSILERIHDLAGIVVDEKR